MYNCACSWISESNLFSRRDMHRGTVCFDENMCNYIFLGSVRATCSPGVKCTGNVPTLRN